MSTTSSFIAAVAVLGLAVSASACGKQATVSGEGGARLSLVKPPAVVLRRGEMAKTDIAIGRNGVTGNVALRFENLPAGVEVVEPGRELTGDKGTYTFRASDTADLVERHVASVTASGPDGVAVTQQFEVTVEDRKP